AGLVAWGTTLDVPTDPGNFVEVSVAVNQTSLLETDAEITNIPGGATRADIGINPEGETIGEGVNQSERPPPIPTMSRHVVTPDVPGVKWRVNESVGIEHMYGNSAVGRISRYDAWPASLSFSADSITFVSVNPLDTSDPIHPLMTWSATSDK